jgi:hypothetical protein
MWYTTHCLMYGAKPSVQITFFKLSIKTVRYLQHFLKYHNCHTIDHFHEIPNATHFLLIFDEKLRERMTPFRRLCRISVLCAEA